jgi:hypothetical protein
MSAKAQARRASPRSAKAQARSLKKSACPALILSTHIDREGQKYVEGTVQQDFLPTVFSQMDFSRALFSVCKEF